MNILQITVILVVSTWFGDDQFYGGGGEGGMVVASMYPTSRIVVISINWEYASILDNMLLLRTLRYEFCKCSVILEHRYVYTKRISNILNYKRNPSVTF